MAQDNWRGRPVVRDANGCPIVVRTKQHQTNSEPACLSGPGRDRPRNWLRLHTIGCFVVETEAGALLLHSRKSCGLLALLALAPRGQRTRVWLRDKLWSSSDETRAATSLRQTIFDLRRAFGHNADNFLIVDRTTIGLRLDHVWVDIRALNEGEPLPAGKETQDLLEGFEVDDEEFEDWLRQERQGWYERRESLMAAAATAPPPSHPLPPARFSEVEAAPTPPEHARLGFLPNILYGCDSAMRFVADRILDGIATNLQEVFPLRIVDLRDATQSSNSLIDSSDTEFYLRVRLLQVNEQATVTLLLYRASRMSLEWCQSFQASVRELVTDANALLSACIAQNVDRVARCLYDSQPGAPGDCLDAGRAAFGALNIMFRLDEGAMANAGHLLSAAREHSDEAILPSLQSYLASFAIGEFFRELDDTQLQKTHDLIDKALAGNPFNSISLACLGHVMGYVFGERDLAGELLERAVKLNPAQAFAWDHYALHKLYNGQPVEAMAAAKTAVRLGQFSPISYSYETTLSMAATLAGNYREALNAGRSALGKQPRFAAAMRYQIANLSFLGRENEAREIYGRLLTVDPDFKDPAVRPSRFRIVDRQTQSALLEAIAKVIS